MSQSLTIFMLNYKLKDFRSEKLSCIAILPKTNLWNYLSIDLLLTTICCDYMVQIWFYITCQNTASIAECTSTKQKIHRYQLYQIYKECNRNEWQMNNTTDIKSHQLLSHDHIYLKKINKVHRVDHFQLSID